MSKTFGRVVCQGYIYVLKHGHPHCNNNGYVLEHRLVMEDFLKDYLKPEEVVHHIDGNKQNNRLANLTVFKNESEHKKYHHKIGTYKREGSLWIKS